MILTSIAAPEHTSSSQRIIHFHISMVPLSPLPRSSSSLWHQPPNLNLQPSLSRQERWFPTGKPSSLWGGPNQKCPIQTGNSTTAGVTNKTVVLCWAKMMDMRFWLLHCRAYPKTNFVITRMLVLKTVLTTTPNTTQTPTMKPTKVLMQASGTRYAHNPSITLS